MPTKLQPIVAETHNSSKNILLSIMKRSPPHTLEGEELDHQKKNEDETKESCPSTSIASVEEEEDVKEVDLPNERLHSDEAESKTLRYFYTLFNHPLQCDPHPNQDEEIQKKTSM